MEFIQKLSQISLFYVFPGISYKVDTYGWSTYSIVNGGLDGACIPILLLIILGLIGFIFNTLFVPFKKFIDHDNTADNIQDAINMTVMFLVFSINIMKPAGIIITIVCALWQLVNIYDIC